MARASLSASGPPATAGVGCMVPTPLLLDPSNIEIMILILYERKSREVDMEETFFLVASGFGMGVPTVVFCEF